MREFFKSCLRDLEQLTGIRQLYFLEQDPEGEQKIKIVLDAMVATARLFPQIPEEVQQKIIREKMVVDQDYTGLHSRIIFKWLNESKYYQAPAPAKKEEPIRELTQEEKERIDAIARKALATLTTPTNYHKDYPGLQQDINRIKLEDQERVQGRKASGYKPDPQKVLQAEKKRDAIHKRGLDKVDFRDLQAFHVEQEIIMARSLEEAQEIYMEVYA